MHARMFAFVVSGVMLGCTSAGRLTDGSSQPAPSAHEVSEKRQTALGLYVTAREAHDLISANPETHTLLDCRPPEAYFYAGHPPGAVNIPYAFMTYRLEPGTTRYVFRRNGEFLERVQDRFRHDETIFVISRSGLRSARAVNVLAEAGFTKVYNVVDGFSGGSGAPGPGWKEGGLPVSSKLDPNLMYVSDQK